MRKGLFMRRPIRIVSAIGLVAGVVLAASVAAAFNDSGDVGPGVEGEPAHAIQQGEGTVIAKGEGPDGIRWSAKRTSDESGLVCIELRFVNAMTEGKEQGAGACFGPGEAETQAAQIYDGNASIAFGLLEGSDGVSSRERPVAVDFTEGGEVAADVVPGGLFFATGRGAPASLSYESTSGSAWRHPFEAGSPSR